MSDFKSEISNLRLGLAWRALGIDAVLIAGWWQVLVTEGMPVDVRVPSLIVLVGSVWAIYLVDHLWDAWRKPSGFDHVRNGWVRKYWKYCVVLVGFCLAVSGWFLTRLSMEMIFAGGVLGVLCLVYYGVRVWHPCWLVGRDFFLGFVFTAGVFLPVLVTGISGYQWVLILGLFFLLTANARICVSAETGTLKPADGIVFFCLGCSLVSFFGSGVFDEAFRMASVAGGLSAVLLAVSALRCPAAHQAWLADLLVWAPCLLVVVLNNVR